MKNTVLRDRLNVSGVSLLRERVCILYLLRVSTGSAESFCCATFLFLSSRD